MYNIPEMTWVPITSTLTKGATICQTRLLVSFLWNKNMTPSTFLKLALITKIKPK